MISECNQKKEKYTKPADVSAVSKSTICCPQVDAHYRMDENLQPTYALFIILMSVVLDSVMGMVMFLPQRNTSEPPALLLTPSLPDVSVSEESGNDREIKKVKDNKMRKRETFKGKKSAGHLKRAANTYSDSSEGY